MPYVKEKERLNLNGPLAKVGYSINSAGVLTYSIYVLCLVYIKNTGRKYLTFATVIGCLVCVVLELYRRVVAPYENIMIEKNGDVK